MSIHYRRIAFLASTACLLLAGFSEAVAPQIRDDGKFFSAAALKKADERIRDIYVKHGRDVLIETFATPPAADLEKVKAMNVEKKGAYFKQWAKSRIEERAVNGAYIMICKEPQHLYVEVAEKKPYKLTADTWKPVNEAMTKEFRASQYDAGLDQALRVLETQLTKK